MNDRIANQLASFRTRLTCLDQPAHTPLWQGVPPLMFTTKVAQARMATEELATMAGRQSAPITGSTADKRREEKELEDEAFKIARAVVNYAQDNNNEALAAKYDMPASGWRRMRDEALLQRARLLIADAGELASDAATTVAAGQFGITTAAVSDLEAEADDYAAIIAVPQDNIGDRSALTASLREKVRQVTRLFDQVADLIVQFGGTPEGDAFIAAYRASSQIIDRGHGPSPEPPPAPPEE